MSKVYKLKRLVIVLYLCSAVSLFAFEWPQELMAPRPFSSHFAQKRGNTFSPSLTFTGSVPVIASDSGHILVKIGQNSNSCAFFPSTLGNAVILAHKDSLLTVYASLESLNLPSDKEEISSGSEIGMSGTSGWHTGAGCLEFQVVDTKNKALINPLVLMPSVTEPYDLQLGKVFLTDKKGSTTELVSRKSIESGSYTLYRNDAAGVMPYKTTVTVNGALVQTVTYDALYLHEQHLYISSKKVLPYTSIYPDNSKQFLAEIHINTGRTVIMVQVFDILGNVKQASYTLEVM